MGDRPVLGVLGGGQLGRMLALAAYPLDIEPRLFDPVASACGGQVAQLTAAPWSDLDAVRRWAESCDAVTYEFENVPEAVARAVLEVAPLRPGVEALIAAQDRVEERELFARCGIATPRWARADTADQLAGVAAGFPLPAIVKTRRGGYDGKGQATLRAPADAGRVFAELGGVPVMLDERISFEREVSTVYAGTGSRTASPGEAASASLRYPLAENTHHRGILTTSVASAACDPIAERACDAAADALAAALSYTGVLAIEFFEAGGAFLANEFAPRVHNTGHWTLDGAASSQFEQHVRAVMGLPLGTLGLVAPCTMVNLIGAVPPREVVAAGGAKLHLYGKSPKPGRKVGHVNLVGDVDAAIAEKLLAWNVYV